SQNRPGVLGDVGFEKRDPHGQARDRPANGDNRENLRQPQHLCDFWSLWRGATCALLARVPIKRRRIEPLGLLLATQLLHARWRAAGSPAAARRRLRVGSEQAAAARTQASYPACASMAVGGLVTRKGL